MPQSSQKMQGAVLVLGMHRSGTSALTRGLEVLGVDLGANLKPPVEGDNDKGFFEHWALSNINDELLAASGGRWDSLFAHAVGQEPSADLNALKLKALHEIDASFGDAAFFAFKDPRTCRTLPFWKDVLARKGVKAHYIIAFRNPMSVAESLEARDHLPRERSYYLWLLHMLAAVEHTQGERRLFVEYDRLLADPAGTLAQIAQLVDDPRVAVGAHALQIYERDFLDKKLRRHRNDASHLDLDPGCSKLVRDVYALLQREADSGASPDAESAAAWGPLLAAFDVTSQHLDYLDVLDREVKRGQDELTMSRGEISHLRHVISERDEQLLAAAAARDGDVASLRMELADLSASLAAQGGEIAAYAAELAARDIRLAAAAAAEEAYRAEIAVLTARLQQEQASAVERLEAALQEAREAARAESTEELRRAQAAAEAERAEIVQRAEAAIARALEEAERNAAEELAETERRYAAALEDVAQAEQQFAQQQIALAEERAAATLAQERAETERRLTERLEGERQHAARVLESERANVMRDAQRDIEAARREVEAAQREIETALWEASKQADSVAAMRRAYEELSERLRAVYASSSWRLTRPMRAFKAAVAGGEVNESVPRPPEAPPAPAPQVRPLAPMRSGAVRRVHFTICAKNYLPIARTCLQSSKRFHPDSEHYLVLCDEVDQGYDPAHEGFTVIRARDLPIPCFEDMALRYDVMEMNTAIKPFCFTHFFGAGADEVVYLDPDLYFLSRMDAVRDALGGDADAVLTPHITRPIEDDKHPNDIDMLRAGVYNLGFLALRRSPDAQAFAAWWGEQLRTMAISDIQRGLFTDQKWCDLLPCFVANTHVLNHPGYNLAYWNLMHRPVAKSGETWTAAGKPISFVHFSGASFSDANVFSKHQNRYDANSIGALRGLYDIYRDEVRANGMGSGPSYKYSFDFDARGRRIAPVLRQLYRDEIANHHPLSQPDVERVYALANEPAPDVTRFPGTLVTRLMHRVWRSRPDLQAAFSLHAEAGQRGFEDWCRHTFSREYGLDERFYPLRDSAPSAGATGGERPPAPMAAISRTVLSQASALRPIYRHLPASLRQRARVLLTKSAYSGRMSEQAEPSRASAVRPGAALVGYARGELGMGEHVRMTAVSMHAEGLPMGVVNISENLLARQEDRRFDHLFSDAEFRANIFHVNADQLPIVCAQLGDRFLAGKKNVAYPFWELSKFPADWTPQLNAMDEVWAPTKFIQDSLSELQRPVVHMPVAVEIAPGYERWRRDDFGLPSDAFVFLFYFDLASFSSRKNPIGVVDAFRLAVEQVRNKAARPVRLVVKVISADRFPNELRQLQELTNSLPGVMLMPDVFAPEQIHGLVNCADAFVSLHRSEGFGRGPAEAMRLGKVAIATAYSGNMDYMNEHNSFPVPYKLRAVGADEYPYGAGQHWADPDVREAGAIMAKLMLEPDLARHIGGRARDYMAKHHGPEAIGKRYAERLKAIGALP